MIPEQGASSNSCGVHRVPRHGIVAHMAEDGTTWDGQRVRHGANLLARWRHRLFNLLAGISAILFLLVIAATSRSFVATDIITYQPRIDYVLHRYVVGWGRGYLTFGTVAAYGDTYGVRKYAPSPMRLDGLRDPSRLFSVCCITVTTQIETAMIREKVRVGCIYMPAWFPALFTGVLPITWLRRQHRFRQIARRASAGQCLQCGYDLRATPARCPECGATAIPVKS